MKRTYVTQSTAWDPLRECWVDTSLYWDPDFVYDIEWLENGCYISRTRMYLWHEISCSKQDKCFNLTMVESTRKLQQKYIHVEMVCKDKPIEYWTEPAENTDLIEQEWNLELDFWEDVETE